MDKLFIGDIPSEYHYAIFSDNHIDLYKQQELTGYLDYYRIYMYDNSFQYDHRYNTYNQYNTTMATYVNVTNDFMFRRDFPSIMFMSVVYCCILVMFLNLVTSVFKKGGY